jgi:transposase InsO family protein
VHRSSFYKWRETRPARERRQAADHALAEQIHAIHHTSHGTYGAPRVTAELCAAGEAINRKKVARVMRAFGIVGLHLRKKHRTTVPAPDAAAVPDLLERDFTAAETNTRYVGDITYLPITGGHFLYLSTVLDLHSKRLAGWSIAEHMRTELVTDALHAAATARGRNGLRGAVFHSDNGAQYASKDFAACCDQLGVTRSRGRVGTSADNAAAESFNASLKRETLQGAPHWPDAATARLDVFAWITRYNTHRRHSAIGHTSPIDYETNSANLALAA